MGGETPHQSSCAYVPKKNGLVVGSAGQDIALGRKSQAVNVIVMSSQRRHLLACGFPRRRLRPPRHSIPEPDCLVVRATRQRVAVWRPCHAAHAGHVANQCVHVRSRGGIPDFDRRVGRGRGDEAAIWRDAHLRDCFGVSMEGQSSFVIGLERFSWRCGRGLLWFWRKGIRS